MKKAWYSRKWVIILMNALAWAVFLKLPVLLQPIIAHLHQFHKSRPKSNNHWEIGFDLVMIGFFYLNAFVFVPRLLYKSNIWRFMVLHAVILFVLMFLFSPFLIFPYITINGLSTAYKLIQDRMQAESLVKEKENENLKTELTLLRSQVSPHFMFNVLNGMVALARKHSDLLEPSLIKLSSLMRYMLYEADEDKVPLDRELEYLQSFIDLQQQRFGNNVRVQADLDASGDPHQIEPMLLIPFVENAFKHGTGIIKNPEIIIRLYCTSEKLHFTVRNRYNADSAEVKDKTPGIGLVNVRRRLNLLYGSRHRLDIREKEGWYEVELELYFL